MECLKIEERLSEYLERNLPSEEMAQVAGHLHECTACSALLEKMRSLLVTCRSFPSVEPEIELIEKILLRTSGRPRTRTFREMLEQYFLRPLLTPRFAVGAALVVLFLVFSANLLLPRFGSLSSLLSPAEWVRQMDRGVQQIYGSGLKAYDAKNEWQAWFSFQKNNIMNRMGFFMEQLDVPLQGRQKPQGQKQQREPKGTSEKSSSLIPPVARGPHSTHRQGVQL